MQIMRHALSTAQAHVVVRGRDDVQPIIRKPTLANAEKITKVESSLREQCACEQLSGGARESADGFM